MLPTANIYGHTITSDLERIPWIGSGSYISHQVSPTQRECPATNNHHHATPNQPNLFLCEADPISNANGTQWRDGANAVSSPHFLLNQDVLHTGRVYCSQS